MLTHSVRVDLEADWVVDGLQERLAAVSEVKHGKDGSTSYKCALLGISNVHNMDIVMAVHLELGVDIVPLVLRWQVNLNFSGGASNRVLDARVADLRANKDVGSKHELMVKVIGHLVLRVLVPHWSHDGKTIAGGLEEQVVHVVCLSVPLLDGSKSSTLHTW